MSKPTYVLSTKESSKRSIDKAEGIRQKVHISLLSIDRSSRGTVARHHAVWAIATGRGPTRTSVCPSAGEKNHLLKGYPYD